ncbi:A disintegrin and metalloproteinase with thrombospondin motifs adt-1 [Aplysia californica]|uniref:A disintegrin and metalloproteinase with thrombospondin motifs adt-1 n=1 Tax=Aplysia californica TaxID=6500 RepID=A0ABM0JC11_APLCA|nr:A disintegrin and metalloproteinase with thrombospondin motifs adt-1 [Aplysia californica]
MASRFGSPVAWKMTHSRLALVLLVVSVCLHAELNTVKALEERDWDPALDLKHPPPVSDKDFFGDGFVEPPDSDRPRPFIQFPPGFNHPQSPRPQWSACRNGFQSRYGPCNDPRWGGRSRSNCLFKRRCSPPSPQPLRSQYGPWSRWSQCDRQGYQFRQRQCQGQGCSRSGLNERRRCSRYTRTPVPYTTAAPYYSSWGAWSEWSDCYLSQKTRNRRCLSSRSCRGVGEQKMRCRNPNDPEESQWQQWQRWAPCSGGLQSRQRQCPGEHCSGFDTQTKVCVGGEDRDLEGTRDPQWSEWSSWSDCFAKVHYRVRTCQGSEKCSGDAYELSECQETEAQRREDWTEWTEWSSCVFGVSRRARGCRKRSCQGPDQERKDCLVQTLPGTGPISISDSGQGQRQGSRQAGGQDGMGWQEWSRWSSVCQNGKRWRRRQCTPGDRTLGRCVGPSSDSKNCQ